MESTPLCFTCGLSIEDPPRINALSDGEPCPACQARVLDSLPPLVPGFSVEVTEVEETPEEGEGAWRPELAASEEADWDEPYEGDLPA